MLHSGFAFLRQFCFPTSNIRLFRSLLSTFLTRHCPMKSCIQNSCSYIKTELFWLRCLGVNGFFHLLYKCFPSTATPRFLLTVLISSDMRSVFFTYITKSAPGSHLLTITLREKGDEYLKNPKKNPL